MHQLQNTNVNFKHFKYGVVTFYVDLEILQYKKNINKVSAHAQNVKYSKFKKLKESVRPAFKLKWGDRYLFPRFFLRCH
jgi:hypothetical protein